MLSLFTRRVALSAHPLTATYTRILPSSASAFRSSRILGNSPRASTVQSFANPQRNASTEVTAKTKKTKSVTVDRKNPGQELTPEQEAAHKELLRAKKGLEKKDLHRKKEAEKAAALTAKLKAQTEKEKERQKAREAKKPKLIKPPPRGISAYSLFVREAKKPLVEICADWKNISEEHKQEYGARAKALTEKRKEEFDAFVKSVTPLDIRRYNRHQRSKGKQTIRVKFNTNRPMHPFMRYAQEFRARPDQAGKRVVEIAKAAGAAWRSLTQDEKDKYKAVPSESATA